MKKYRLLESGDYLLGIETTIISEVFSLRQLLEKQGKNVLLLAPADLFAGRQHNRPSPEPVVLQTDREPDNPFLYFDRDMGEFSASMTREMPLLYPQKAARVCPEMAIINNSVVLCLNTEALYAMYAELSSERFLLDIDQLIKAESVCTKVQTEVGQTPDNGNPEAENEQTGTTTSANNKSRQKTAEPPEKTTVSTKNEDPVMSIITWISSNYEKISPDNKARFGRENIPATLLEQAALDDTSLRYLIDQTIVRLQKRQR